MRYVKGRGRYSYNPLVVASVRYLAAVGVMAEWLIGGGVCCGPQLDIPMRGGKILRSISWLAALVDYELGPQVVGPRTVSHIWARATHRPRVTTSDTGSVGTRSPGRGRGLQVRRRCRPFVYTGRTSPCGTSLRVGEIEDE